MTREFEPSSRTVARLLRWGLVVSLAGLGPGAVAVQAADASFALDFGNAYVWRGIVFNDTGVAQTVEVGGVPIMLAAGPFLRVKADGATLGVLGVTLSGNFSFEQQETTTGSEKVVSTMSVAIQPK